MFERENTEITESGKGKALFRRVSVQKLLEGKIMGGILLRRAFLLHLAFHLRRAYGGQDGGQDGGQEIMGKGQNHGGTE
jgi:hypothetical protein